VLASGIADDPFGNVYFDATAGAKQKFWKITTDP
jgi:hypothetical protein